MSIPEQTQEVKATTPVIGSQPATKPFKWLSEVISVLALCVAIFAAWNSWRQADNGLKALEETKNQVAATLESVETAKKQLATAQRAQETAEHSYAVARASYEQQSTQFAQDEAHSLVYEQQFLNALESPITNGHQFKLAFQNKSKSTHSYFIKVETEGFFVDWPSTPPSNPKTAIFLNRNPVAISSESSYAEGFVIWLYQSPPPKATLRIKVNDRVVFERNYIYEKISGAYVRNGT
jgi:Fe-S cluster assembly scaffold protein SufB